MRRVFRALFPGAIVFAVAIVVMLLPGGDSIAQDVASTYGKVVYGAGLALAWVFHRSRVFTLLLCLGLMDVAIAEAPDKRELVLAFGTALAALIALLAVTRDRGIASRGGLLHIALGAAFASTFSRSAADCSPSRMQVSMDGTTLTIRLRSTGRAQATLVVTAAPKPFARRRPT